MLLGLIALSSMAQVASVESNPMSPTLSAAMASPAMSPPPRSEAVLMSAGSAPSASSFFFGQADMRLPTTPPAANHAEVARLRNRPKEDAYGDGSTTASSRKSIENPTRPDLTK